MLQLKFKGDLYKPVSLIRKRVMIGRDSGNDVVLNETGVSGFHAEIQIGDGKVYVVDLGSTNGTFVNGSKISGRQEIKLWDTLRFEKVEAEIVDTEKRRPTMVNRAISEADLQTSVPADSTQVRAGVSSFTLMGTSGVVAGKSFAVAGKLIVGREAGCGLQIDEQMVSRQHAEIEVIGGMLKIRDLGSANGTFVNGNRVTEIALKAGDEIRFDQVSFKVAGPGDAAKTSVRAAIDGQSTQMRPAVGAAPADPASTTTGTGGAKARLIGADGAAAGKTFPLAARPSSIGRTADNDIVISDPTVSSKHARLLPEGSGWKIEDAGSSNGTLVNGKKIQSQILKDGDKIQLGKVELKFEAAMAAAGGTQMMGAIGGNGKTAVMSAAKKSLPAWVYGLVGFALVAVIAGIWFWKSSPPQITAKLQAGKVWEQTLSGGRLGPATPLLADINGDKFLDVIVADASGYVLALDGQEGKKIFEAAVSDRILAPPVTADLNGDQIDDLIVASNSGLVVALNGKGQTLWKSSGDLDLGEILNRPVLQDLNGDKVPDVILPTSQMGLVALDGSRGWKMWDTAEMTRGKMITSPVRADVNGDKIPDFIGVTDSGQVLAVTGQGDKVWQIWEGEVPPVYCASPVFIEVGEQALVIVASDGAGIVALNAGNGRMAWSAKVNKRFFASPVAADANGDDVPDVVAVAENGDIHVLDSLNGEEIWSTALGITVQASPALFDVNNDKMLDLIILDGSGGLHLVDMNRGRALLQLPASGVDAFIASPVLGDVNNDELVDIVAAGQNGTIVSYWINRVTERSSSPWPQFLGNDQHGIQ
ncbi:MAG: FHA domain-containing protein [Syntrophotaleaceae bacterium]